MPDSSIDRLIARVSYPGDEVPDNNEAMFRFTGIITDRPDLYVTNLSFDPTPVEPDYTLPYGTDEVTIKLTAGTSGKVLVTEGLVDLTIRYAGPESLEHEEQISVPVLFAPESIQSQYSMHRDLEIPWRPPAEGTYVVEAAIRATGAFEGTPESDEEDNQTSARFYYQLEQGNLTATGLAVAPNPAAVGERVTLTLDVANNSVTEFNQVPVRFYHGDPAAGPAVELGTAVVQTIGLGQTQEAVLEVELKDPGVYTVFAYIDPAGTLPEQHREDNRLGAQLEVYRFTQQDLTLHDEDHFDPPAQVVQGTWWSI